MGLWQVEGGPGRIDVCRDGFGIYELKGIEIEQGLVRGTHQVVLSSRLGGGWRWKRIDERKDDQEVKKSQQ